METDFKVLLLVLLRSSFIQHTEGMLYWISTVMDNMTFLIVLSTLWLNKDI